MLRGKGSEYEEGILGMHNLCLRFTSAASLSL